MDTYREVWYERDNLRLFARDYYHQNPAATVLCMPGLTRNSADFETLCLLLKKDYRCIACDQRGRGLSDYDTEPSRYQPQTYVADMFALLDTLDISHVILIGTSLGGLMAMAMCALQPERIQAVVLNDIGPEINPEGLRRIQQYVGQSMVVNRWQEALENTKTLMSNTFLNMSDVEWEHFCRGIYRPLPNERFELAYDPAIAEAFKYQQSEPTDLWDVFQSMKEKPLLVIRGQLSDILSDECVSKMQLKKPNLSYCEVPDRGHAPFLSEAVCLKAVSQFMKGLH